MKQYEIWWATLPLPIGRRPVLLLSRGPAYSYLSKVLVAEGNTTIHRIPQEVAVGKTEGLPSLSVVNFDNLDTIPKNQLKKRAGAVKPGHEVEIKRALGHTLGWIELTAL